MEFHGLGRPLEILSRWSIDPLVLLVMGPYLTESSPHSDLVLGPLDSSPQLDHCSVLSAL